MENVIFCKVMYFEQYYHKIENVLKNQYVLAP